MNVEAGRRPGWPGRRGLQIDYQEVLARVGEDAKMSGHYVFMTIVSAGIAVLGLLLSSPAVVIGAMLISPLMGPIVGLGFGIALFDFDALRRSLTSMAVGLLLAIGFSAMVVLLSPVQSITSEIASRTRPNLFDLGVAVLAGLAATYAMIRGRQGAIVGVAIAVALMPPLAAVGFGLATLDKEVFLGAAFLFFTNFMAIALSAAALARVYGFGHYLSRQQTGLQAILVIAGLTVLAVPLSLALRRIAGEALASGDARAIIQQQFGADARVSQLDIDYKEKPVHVNATVFTSTSRAGAQKEVAKLLGAKLGEPVSVDIEQVRVTRGGADAAQLAASRVQQAHDRDAALAEQLALVAGQPASAVLIDSAKRLARVKATELPGASLQTYRALEERIAADNPDWTVDLVPPLTAALPTLAADARPEEIASAVDAVAWGSGKTDMHVVVTGPKSDEIAQQLIAKNVPARASTGHGTVRFAWDLPAAATTTDE